MEDSPERRDDAVEAAESASHHLGDGIEPASSPVADLEPGSPATSRAPLAAIAFLPGFALVILVWAVAQLWGLERAPFHTKGEPREAIVVQEVIRTGNWILPRRNGVEMPAKPPLFHWLGALSAMMRGQADELSIRLPSAVLSLASGLMIFLTGALLWSVSAGVAAAAATLTSFEWLRAATSARVDMTLTAGLTFTVCGLALFRSRGGFVWLGVAYAGMAWSILAKGPVGLALPVLLIMAVTIADRGLAFARSLRLIRGLAAVLIVGCTWYLLAFFEGGREFFTKQILTENVGRLLGGPAFTEGHRHSVGYLLASFAAGLLPWTLFLPSVLFTLWRRRRTLVRHDPRVFLLIWIVIVFGFYSVAESKRGVYLLAAYPGVFLLLGAWLASPGDDEDSGAWLARLLTPVAWLMAFLAGVIALVAVGERHGLPILSAAADLVSPRAAGDLRQVAASFRSAAGLVSTLMLGAVVTAAAAACAARAREWRWTAALLVLTTISMIAVVRGIVLPQIAEANTRRSFVAAIKRTFGDDVALSAYRGFDYGFVYYWGREVPVYREPLSPAAPPRLVLSDDAWHRADPRGRDLYQPLPLLRSPRSGNVGALLFAQRTGPDEGQKPEASKESALEEVKQIRRD